MSGPPDVTPHDEHNAALVANVHPPDWRNPEPARRYNLVVIGAGTAGLVTAAGAAGLGARVALVERHLMGGDCLNVGCVPSKALIRAARAVADVRDAGRFGVRVPERRRGRLRRGDGAHAAAARRHQPPRLRRALPRSWASTSSSATARFSGPDTVEVAGCTLRFKKAVIATGARAVRPPIPGLEEAGYLTNETVFSLTERPARLAVIGAGPIGCELAQAFARLGSGVTVVRADASACCRARIPTPRASWPPRSSGTASTCGAARSACA